MTTHSPSAKMRRLRALQGRISAVPGLIRERNALLVELNDAGVTQAALATELSLVDRDHGGSGLSEDAVQKAIRLTRAAK